MKLSLQFNYIGSRSMSGEEVCHRNGISLYTYRSSEGGRRGYLCKLLFTLQASAKANPLPSNMIIFHGNLFDISLKFRRPGGGLFTVQ